MFVDVYDVSRAIPFETTSVLNVIPCKPFVGNWRFRFIGAVNHVWVPVSLLKEDSSYLYGRNIFNRVLLQEESPFLWGSFEIECTTMQSFRRSSVVQVQWLRYLVSDTRYLCLQKMQYSLKEDMCSNVSLKGREQSSQRELPSWLICCAICSSGVGGHSLFALLGLTSYQVDEPSFVEGTKIFNACLQEEGKILSETTSNLNVQRCNIGCW